MEATQSDKPKRRLLLNEQELSLLNALLLNGGSLLDNKTDEEKKSYRSLFDKVKKMLS